MGDDKLGLKREDIEKALDITKKNESTPINQFLAKHGAKVAGAGGAVAGAAAAGTIAGALGVTSITGLTTVASWVGVTAVAATPVGWVLGSAAAIGTGAFALTKWYGMRKANSANAMNKIEKFQKMLDAMNKDDLLKKNADLVKKSEELLDDAVIHKVISEEQAVQLKNLLQAGQLSPQALSQMLAKQYETMKQDQKLHDDNRTSNI